MEVSELRQFTVDELKGRIRQWQDDLFRNRFKTETSEAKDTSVGPKTRRNIARAFTVLGEKSRGVEFAPKAPKTPKKASSKATLEAKAAKSEEKTDVATKKAAPKKKVTKES